MPSQNSWTKIRKTQVGAKDTKQLKRRRYAELNRSLETIRNTDKICNINKTSSEIGQIEKKTKQVFWSIFNEQHQAKVGA